MWLLLGAALAQTEAQPEWALDRVVDGAHWTLAAGELRRDGAVITDKVRGLPVFAAGRVVFTRLAIEPIGTELIVLADGKQRVLAGPETRPDRIALSPDGRHVAYVSGRTGWASVYVQALSDEQPVQLTNTAVHRRKGQPPLGFTAPPREGLEFRGDSLCWHNPEPVCISWRRR